MNCLKDSRAHAKPTVDLRFGTSSGFSFLADNANIIEYFYGPHYDTADDVYYDLVIAICVYIFLV